MVDFPEKHINSELNIAFNSADIYDEKHIKQAAIIDFKDGGGFTSSVDKEFTSLDSTLIYTITLKNTGNITASNVVFREKLKECGDIVPGTVFVNGSLQGVADPTFKNGIIVGDIKAGKVSIVKYNFKTSQIPENNKIKSIGQVTFNYIDDLGNNCIGYGESNLVVSTLNIALIHTEDMTFTQSINSRYLDVNEVITYKIDFENIGNSPANNILLKDIISEGAFFIYDSVIVNGCKSLGIVNNNIVEIPVGVLNPNKSCQVLFSIRLDKIPKDNLLKNRAEIYYSYIDNPEKEQLIRNVKFRDIIIPIKNVNFSGENFKLEVNRNFADINDEITYTITLKNTGSISANKVIIEKAIPKETNLIENSMYINGKNELKNYNNNIIFLGEIKENQLITVSYKVKLKEKLPIDCIKNQCKLNYNYEIEEGRNINNVINSNDVFTKINTAYISAENNSFLKLADKAYVKVGEIVNYTLRIRNMGNVEARNLIVKDEVPLGMSFINGSIYVNGFHRENNSILFGVLIERLAPDETVIVSYSMVVKNLSNNNILINSATLEYEYLVDIANSKIKKVINSNPCEITVNDIDFTGENIRTIVDKNYAEIGDEVTYTTRIINKGNLSGKNAVFKVAYPEEVIIIPNSILVNGTILECGDISSGIFLGNIEPNKLIEVTYKVQIYKISVDNIFTNKMELNYMEQINPNTLPVERRIYKEFQGVNVNSIKIVMKRECNTQYAVVGETITYIIKLFNEGNLDVEDVFIRDRLSDILEFIHGSLKIDNKFKNENIINGINIGEIPKGKSRFIEFSAKVLSYPKEGKIFTNSSCTYKYLLNSQHKPLIATLESEANVLNIKNIDISIDKYCSLSEVNINDLIEFRINIENRGEVEVYGFIFKENLPSELEFVNSSFSINGIKVNGVNIKSGIMIGKIKRGEKVQLLFSALVKYAQYSYTAYSESYGEYSYKFKPNGEIKKGNCKVALKKIRILNDIKKNITIEGICELADKVSTIENINNIRANIHIVNSYICNNKGGFLDDGLEKSYKVIINAVLKQMVDFDARLPTGMISNTAEFSKKFSSFIIIPGNYKPNKNINITSKIQDIFFNKIDNKNISTSILVTFIANVL